MKKLVTLFLLCAFSSFVVAVDNAIYNMPEITKDELKHALTEGDYTEYISKYKKDYVLREVNIVAKELYAAWNKGCPQMSTCLLLEELPLKCLKIMLQWQRIQDRNKEKSVFLDLASSILLDRIFHRTTTA